MKEGDFLFLAINNNLAIYTFSELKTFLAHNKAVINLESEINFLSFDSRQIIYPKQTIFFAIQTKNSDGHEYLKNAYFEGVRSFVIENQKETYLQAYENVNYLVVDNSVHALQDIASKHRNRFNLPVIGITGSNGKTIVKEWLSALVDSSFKVLKSPKSYNSQIGVPISVWGLSADHNLGIFEAGISQEGEMERLERIINPVLGILTNIGTAHDSGFQSKRKKLAEKLKLFCNSSKLIIRQEEKSEVLDLGFDAKKLIIWGNSKGNNYVVEFEPGGILRINNIEYKVPFKDEASIENITHAIIAALYFGIGHTVIQNRLSFIKAVPMRLEVKQGENDCIIIDDSYNHDLAGMEAALTYMHRYYENSEKSLIISHFENQLNQNELFDLIVENHKKKAFKNIVLIGSEKISNKDFILFKRTEDFLNSTFWKTFQNEVIIIKGSRTYGFERIVKKIEKRIHGTRLEVNLNALNNNLKHFRSLLNEETKLMVMVKAFAYGLGNKEIAGFLEQNNVDYLGVAYADEGVELRQQGLEIPIFIMNPSPQSLALCFQYDLEPEIYSFNSLNAYLTESAKWEKELPVHLNIDTGMNRLGFRVEELPELKKRILKNDLRIASVFSHLASSDDSNDEAFTLKQIQSFEKAYGLIIDSLTYRPIKHILNTAGILNYKSFQFDMVRLGVGLYGIDNTKKHQGILEPVGRLISEISQIKEITAMDSVGYGRKGNLSKGGRIATIPIGYADGFFRSFSNGIGKVSINGEFASVIGNVCMDMIMVDISNINAEEGDEVVIFGPELPIEKLSDWADTIPYEILTSISERVKRVYISD